MYVCMYSNLPLLYLKLHVVHEITVTYMALFSEPLSHQKNHLIKKEKKKLVYCNVFRMASPLVFGINFFFKP